MKVSIEWLRDYVDITVSVEELAERLTMAGLEVGDIQFIGEDWQNITVGKIVSVDAHPNADRLRLVTVDLGEHQSTVVCGAPNLTVGDKVAFAHVGACLRDGHSEELVELKPAKIRGILSEGMVCSERELGISDSHEGIMILSSEAPVGVALSEHLGDTILDLDVTPNRPDCLSIVGVAREIAALTGSNLHISGICYEEADDTVESFVSVGIDEPHLCPRYCASVLADVRIGHSPQWLQRRLLACGMRPISNIVDVTNYVMLEYGQPLHAFDFHGLRGKQINVRRGEGGEVISTLDGIERIISQDMLVIADGERTVAVAGIMGGADAEVTNDTKTVLLEAANFNQAVIHEGSIGLRLSSEASLRFEKGLSRELPMVALRRATQLMQELTGAKVARGLIDVYPGKQQEEPILLSTGEVERLLGMEIAIGEIIKALETLGFICKLADLSSQIRVTVPWWRTDVSCAADLVEEIVRIVGYDNIPVTMLSSSLPVHESMPVLPFREKLRNILVGCGLQEILTYSLISMEVLKKLSPELCLIGHEPLKVAYPMSREQEYLRTTLRPGVLSTLARNQRYQQKGIRLFELGKIFLPRREDLPHEKEMLCIVLSGSQNELFWYGEAEPVDFFIAKGVAETILTGLGLNADFLSDDDASLCSGRNAAITVDNKKIGIIGELHPKVASAFEISDTTYLIEFDLEKVLSLVDSSYYYSSISRYPSIIRDIALIVDKQINYQQVSSIIRDFPMVTQVTLFDVYLGEQVPKGKKSFAFRILYQLPTHTLSDDEADKVQRRILDRLTQELGATLRV